MINVYDNGEIIAQVERNDCLDYWDGRNWTCGSTGRHQGLEKLKDGRIVLINSTQWQGERNSAEIISKKRALQLILESDQLKILEDFPEVKKLYEDTVEQVG